MPQIDILSFVAQIVFLFILFLSLVSFSSYYFLPRIAFVLKFRSKKLQTLTSETLSLASASESIIKENKIQVTSYINSFYKLFI